MEYCCQYNNSNMPDVSTKQGRLDVPMTAVCSAPAIPGQTVERRQSSRTRSRPIRPFEGSGISVSNDWDTRRSTALRNSLRLRGVAKIRCDSIEHGNIPASALRNRWEVSRLVQRAFHFHLIHSSTPIFKSPKETTQVILGSSIVSTNEKYVQVGT